MISFLLTVAVFALIYALMTLALNLQFGFAGLINFGAIGFVAIGAYTSAIMARAGLPLALSLPASVLFAALAAWPVGLLSLRLRMEYFAITTLGFAESVRLVVSQEQWLTGGEQGINGIPSLAQAIGLGGGSSVGVSFVGALVAVALVTLISLGVVRSPFGRMIRAIRDDEDAVRALGKSPPQFKIRIFVLSSAFLGLAGALYAHYITYVSPEQFAALTTFYIWVAMIMGGAGSIAGSIVGAVLLMLFIDAPQFLPSGMLGLSAAKLASLRLGVIGLALMLLIRFRPNGILGDRRTP